MIEVIGYNKNDTGVPQMFQLNINGYKFNYTRKEYKELLKYLWNAF